MKYIQKKPEPDKFIQWKAAENPDWRPVFDNMPGDIKQVLQEALMNEQGCICCYCERQLVGNDSHVEHLHPQCKYPDRALDYNNMFCSCQRNLQPKEPRHCGNLKDKWFEELQFVSPLDPECQLRFKYTADGNIYSREMDDSAAHTTIIKLGLNIDKLRRLREKAIEPFLEPNLTLTDLNNFVTKYLQSDEQGKFNPFYSTIQYLQEKGLI